MKKIKTINKLLSSLTLLSSSLTLLSPLSGIGFNNQYQSTQKVIIKNTNNSLNNYVNLNAEQVQMGDITVEVEGTKILTYVSGEGTLLVSSNIIEIEDDACYNNYYITSLDLSQATSLTTIGYEAFYSCLNLTGDLVIPSSVTNIAGLAFNSPFDFVDLSNAQHLSYIGEESFGSNWKDFSPTPKTNKNFSQATNLGSKAKVLISGSDGLWKDDSSVVGGLALGSVVFPSSITKISSLAFSYTNISSVDFSKCNGLISISGFNVCKNLTGKITIPSSVTTIEDYAFANTPMTSLDLSNARNLTTIGNTAFYNSKLSGDLVIPSSVIRRFSDSI